MRTILILGLAAVAGCGASQAAPVAVKPIAAHAAIPVEPAEVEYIATPVIVGPILISQAALGVPMAPTGWRVEIVAAHGTIAFLAGQTFDVPGRGGGSVVISTASNPNIATIVVTNDATDRTVIVANGVGFGGKGSARHNNVAIPIIGLGCDTFPIGGSFMLQGKGGAVVNVIPY